MRFLRNGMGTVNCGDLREVDGVEVEVLSPAISRHLANIVCTYINDGGRKIEVTFYNDGGKTGHEVYSFRRATDAHHYYSRNYREGNVPAKYAALAERLKAIHTKVFA